VHTDLRDLGSLLALHHPSAPASPTQSGSPSSPSSSSSSSSDLDTDEAADADDLAQLRAQIEALAPGSEERRMAAREWKRMRRMQPSSVEAGVVRSYVSLPPSLSNPRENRD
jgi:ATP-dependent Lon protease